MCLQTGKRFQKNKRTKNNEEETCYCKLSLSIWKYSCTYIIIVNPRLKEKWQKWSERSKVDNMSTGGSQWQKVNRVPERWVVQFIFIAHWVNPPKDSLTHFDISNTVLNEVIHFLFLLAVSPQLGASQSQLAFGPGLPFSYATGCRPSCISGHKVYINKQQNRVSFFRYRQELKIPALHTYTYP